MSDVNESLLEQVAAQNDMLTRENDRLRAFMERPLTVTVQAPEESTLKRIGEYLPKFGEMAANTAFIAGELKQMKGHQEATANTLRSMQRASELQGKALEAIAEALERLIPERPASGPEFDDRHFHMEAGMPWDGRLCKKYGLVWTVIDPGDADPTSEGDECTVPHKVWADDA